MGPCPPVLELNQEFEYTSQARLRCLKGTMRGSYTMVRQESGTILEAIVGPFALSPPKAETKAAETNGEGREGGGDRGRAAKEKETAEK
jgi:hypothetical protein